MNVRKSAYVCALAPQSRKLSTLHFVFVLALIACLTPRAFSQCEELDVTNISNNDVVPSPVLINGTTNCGDSGMQIKLWIDGSAVTIQNGTTFSYSDSLADGAHTLALQGYSNGSLVVQSPTINFTVGTPASGETGFVNIWNPTGCPTTASCGQQETVPTTFYVDASVYSTASNIWVVQSYLDGNKATQQVVSNVNYVNYHSPAITTTAGSNHYLVVQALTSSNAIVAKSVAYINATGSPTVFSNMNIVSGTDGIPASDWQTAPCCESQNLPAASTSIVESGQANSLEFFANSGSYAMSYDYLDWAKTWHGDPANSNAPIKYVKYEFDVYIPSGQTVGSASAGVRVPAGNG